MVLNNQRKFSQLVNSNSHASSPQELKDSGFSDLIEAQLQREMKGTKHRPSFESLRQDLISKLELGQLQASSLFSGCAIALLCASSSLFYEMKASDIETSLRVSFSSEGYSLAIDRDLGGIFMDLLDICLRMRQSLLSSSLLKSGFEKTRWLFARWFFLKPYMLSWRTKLFRLLWQKYSGSSVFSRPSGLRMVKQVPLLFHNKNVWNCAFCIGEAVLAGRPKVFG